MYQILKDFLVPLISPLIAAVALGSFLYQERRKSEVRRKHDVDIAVRSIYRDLLYLREAYQLLRLKQRANEAIEPERRKLIIDTADRIFGQLLTNPEIFEKYFVKANTGLKSNRFPLFLTELQIRLARIAAPDADGEVILFGIYLLLYLYDPDPIKANEHRAILQQISNTNPQLFGAFAVARDDDPVGFGSLRVSSNRPLASAVPSTS